MELATARWNLHSTTFVHPDDAAVVYNDQKLMVGYSSKFTLLYLNKEWVLLKGLNSFQFHILNKSGKVCLIHFQNNVFFYFERPDLHFHFPNYVFFKRPVSYSFPKKYLILKFLSCFHFQFQFYLM